jgi:branched-chain amino acid transport system ATP-binding protein/urea transport system ATP-binding protein
MLRADGIRAGYGTTPVLQDLDFSVGAGERVAVLGRNGAGKSTLLKSLVGQLPLTAGTITFEGQDVSRLPAYERARRGIAYVPQGRDIFPGLTVLDNLRVAAYGTRRKNWKGTMDEVLDQFPVLREKGDLPGSGLSGGQQQILALARALMTRPRLLLLDEPSEGIQPSIVSAIATHVRDVNERDGITVVIVEQNLEFATRVASHANIMEKGRIVRDLSSADVLNDRQLQHEYMGV